MWSTLSAQADGVLAAIRFMLGDDIRKVMIEPYVNCREQGWSIQVYESKRSAGFKDKASFSEHRRSDSIVVYVGMSTDFSMQGNVPSDEAYKASQNFPPMAFESAARCVLAELGLIHRRS